MPDDYDGDGAPPSGPGGKRRAPDPADQPRRRRRSLDDGDGVSVSDLVERHTASRADLPAPGRRRADESRHAAPESPRPKRGGVEDLGAAMQGRRAAAEQADTPPGRHGRRQAPEQPPGRLPDHSAPAAAYPQQPYRESTPPAHRGAPDPTPRGAVDPAHRAAAEHHPPAHRAAPDLPSAHHVGPDHQPSGYRGAPDLPSAHHVGPDHHAAAEPSPRRAPTRRATPDPLPRRAGADPELPDHRASDHQPPDYRAGHESLPRRAAADHQLPDHPAAAGPEPLPRRPGTDRQPPGRRVPGHDSLPRRADEDQLPDHRVPGHESLPRRGGGDRQVSDHRAAGEQPLPRRGAVDHEVPGHRGVEQPTAHRAEPAVRDGLPPNPPEANHRPRPRRAPRGPVVDPVAPPVEPGGPQRASIPADVVRQATGAHRIPADAGLDFDQYVPPEPPRRPAPPRPARPLPEPTRTGDLPEDDRPSAHYPPRHEPFPRDHHEPPTPDDHFPVDHRAPDADRRPSGPHPRPTARHPLPRPTEDHPATGRHPLPGPPATFADTPHPSRRQPTGQHPLAPEDPAFPDAPRPARRQPTGQPIAAEDPAFADAPRPGRRQPTGQHPIAAEDPAFADGLRPGRRQPTGQHPIAPEDSTFADGPRPGRRQPTGQHPLAPEDPAFVEGPHRRQPPGHPMPPEDAFADAPRPGRRQPTGQHPIAPEDPALADGPHPGRRQGPGRPMPVEDYVDGPLPGRRPIPAEDAAFAEGPHPGRRQAPGHPMPAEDFADGPQPSRRQHPADDGFGQRRPQPPGRFPADADGPHPSGRFPVDADGPQPSGRFPIDTDGPQPSGRFPVDAEGPQRSGRFPVDADSPQPSGRFPVDPAADIAARLDGEGKPRIPRQQPPGQSSMPNPAHPEETQKVALTPPPGVSPADAVGMTTEMEPIGEATQKRRRVDQTLARFSKVHDELKAEEKAKRAKRRLPWNAEDDELEEQLEELAKPPGEAGADAEEKPKPKKRGLFARVFAGTTAILVFTATGVGWGFLKHTGDSIDKVRALDPNSDAIQNAEAQHGDENFLLIGSDSREGAEAEDGVGDAGQVPGARADTTMIAHVPADRSRVVIVSFPRDLEIQRPECERFDPATNDYTGETVAGQQAAKLNTAYQVGGPLCATKVVQELSGLRITRFIGIDFHGFKDMVDAVDGVSVCVEEPMYDTYMKKWIVQKAGTAVELRGDQALDFVRARHVRGDPTSDYGRIKRQQRFLSSLLRKSMSGQVLLDPGKLTGFTEAFTKSTFGDNITVESLFSLGQSLQGLEAGRVTFLTVPTVGLPNDRGNEELRVEDNAALFRAIVNNQPLPGEKPAEKADTQQRALPQSSPLRARQQQVDPKTLKIQVLNGGNTTGRIARDTGEKLAEYGYDVMMVSSAPKVAHTVIYYGTGNEAAARTLASSIPGVHLVADASMGKALVLVIGPEYDGEVVAPGTAKVTEPEPEKLPEDLSAINGGDVTCA
ncbi:LCP family protein [Actinokineospora sp. UTMC 2448]|uniref:LCP family glycopolymer transferase n=1 Tax=Actinokineospora sp. UTMC 2448 TaxID=2268449 RepID=UPI002164205E|nr:LCP family protein [Actinokineospora sp. UTMC 2448]UVS82450.1 Biofilm regulatory protein A precursor [Actinokineospora sp. UTMC 2448]